MCVWVVCGGGVWGWAEGGGGGGVGLGGGGDINPYSNDKCLSQELKLNIFGSLTQ